MTPPRPPFTAAKFADVRPETGWSKTICQVAVAALRGLPLARFSETTVASGRSTGLVVGLAVPAKAGSSVRMEVKLLPLTVPWLLMSWVLAGSLTKTVPTMVTLLPAGRVPMLMVAPRRRVVSSVKGVAPAASPGAGRRRSPVLRWPYMMLQRLRRS